MSVESRLGTRAVIYLCLKCAHTHSLRSTVYLGELWRAGGRAGRARSRVCEIDRGRTSGSVVGSIGFAPGRALRGGKFG